MTGYEQLQRKYRKVLYPCELCGSEEFAELQSHGRVAAPGEYGTLQIKICKVCGFKMQNPRFEDQFYIDYYDAMYREVAFGTARPSDEYIEQQKQRGAGVLAFATEVGARAGIMLDHGCASGATMLAWQEKGWATKGVDPHRPSVEAGREMGLEIEVAAGENLPFGNCSFDLVLSLGSFEHSYDLSKTMEEAARVLRQDGWLVIRWRSNEIFGSPLEYYNHNHYRFFSPRTWRLCLERFGFSIMATTDRRLEGWDSYSYIVARKRDKPRPDAVHELVASGVRDDYKTELQDLKKLRHDYYHSCRKFLDLAEVYADRPEMLVDMVRNGDVGFRWGLLGGDAAQVIARSCMDATRYIAEYECGRVV